MRTPYFAAYAAGKLFDLAEGQADWSAGMDARAKAARKAGRATTWM